MLNTIVITGLNSFDIGVVKVNYHVQLQIWYIYKDVGWRMTLVW